MKRLFKYIFGGRFFYSDFKLFKLCICHAVTIGSSNGLTLNKRQAITWNNIAKDLWRHMTSLSHNESNSMWACWDYSDCIDAVAYIIWCGEARSLHLHWSLLSWNYKTKIWSFIYIYIYVNQPLIRRVYLCSSPFSQTVITVTLTKGQYCVFMS